MECNNNKDSTCKFIDASTYNNNFHTNSKAIDYSKIDLTELLELLKAGDIELQLSEPKKGITGKALEHALDIRKFEIELYWKRATYFWTFIAAVLIAFFAIYSSENLEKSLKQDFSVMLSCLGVVFSFAWVLVNKGSKFWQENWEQHVDALEDSVTGPLYKTIMPKKDTNWLVNSAQISVSKVNQLVSIYVFLLWCLLLAYVIVPTFNFDWLSLSYFQTIIIAFTFLTCGTLYCLGSSSSANKSTTHAMLRPSWSPKKENEND